MKTAVLISGQLRALDRCYDSIHRHILSRIGDHDIFAQIPDDHDAKKIDRYSPRRILASNPPQLEEKNYIHSSGRLAYHIQRVLIMLWRMQEANRLKTETEIQFGFRYDWVVRLRVDSEYFSDVEDLQELERNCIYIPTFGNYWGYNDRFAFGGSEVMDVYHDKLYNRLDDYIANGGIFHPESILKGVLDRAGIPVRRTSVVFDTVRDNGDRVRPVWEAFYGDELPEWKRACLARQHRCSPSQIAVPAFGLPVATPVHAT